MIIYDYKLQAYIIHKNRTTYVQRRLILIRLPKVCHFDSCMFNNTEFWNFDSLLSKFSSKTDKKLALKWL